MVRLPQNTNAVYYSSYSHDSSAGKYQLTSRRCVASALNYSYRVYAITENECVNAISGLKKIPAKFKKVNNYVSGFSNSTEASLCHSLVLSELRSTVDSRQSTVDRRFFSTRVRRNGSLIFVTTAGLIK